MTDRTRAIAIAGASLAFAVVLGIIGINLAMSLVHWKMTVLGLDEIIITRPDEPARVEMATALVFGWPAIVGGVAATIHHVRRGPPSGKQLAIYFAIPLAAMAVITLLLVWASSTHLPPGDSAIRPMITLASLGPGADEAKVGAFVAAVLWLYVTVKRPT